MRQMKQWMLASILTLCGVATAQAQDVSYVERSWDETCNSGTVLLLCVTAGRFFCYIVNCKISMK